MKWLQLKIKIMTMELKETCAIMPTQVTHEIDLISLLRNSAMSSALNFCFLCILSLSKRKRSW